jgi:hypothetical protein
VELGSIEDDSVTGRVEEPTFYAALEEMQAADELIRARSQGWAWAIGADRWLSWLMGRTNVFESRRLKPVDGGQSSSRTSLT